MTGGPSENAPAPEPDGGVLRRVAISRRHAIGAATALVVIVAVVIALRYRTGNERRRYDGLLRASLDKIVTAQEGYYYDSTRYVGSLRALPTVQLPTGVHVQLHNPDRRSWWGIATHDRLPAYHCIVWVGTAPTTLPLEARAPENETKPLCFDDAGAGRQTRPS